VNARLLVGVGLFDQPQVISMLSCRARPFGLSGTAHFAEFKCGASENDRWPVTRDVNILTSMGLQTSHEEIIQVMDAGRWSSLLQRSMNWWLRSEATVMRALDTTHDNKVREAMRNFRPREIEAQSQGEHGLNSRR
jgi:hypothetical protein